MSELWQLADRCEAASEGSFDLDNEILIALGYSWRGMGYWFRDDSHQWKGGKSFTTSLDAAMTLVPEDASETATFWQIGNDGEGGDPALFKVRILIVSRLASEKHIGLADTPALALTAAALRARANIAETGKQPGKTSDFTTRCV